jgi:hypothetical protein
VLTELTKFRTGGSVEVEVRAMETSLLKDAAGALRHLTKTASGPRV